MKPFIALILCVAAVSVTATTGCGSSDDQPSETTGGTPTTGTGTGGESSSRSHGPTVADIDGKTFVSTLVKGRRLVPGTKITLSFGPENLTANAGCTTMIGPYSLAGDGLQVTGDMAQTMIGCEPELVEQDSWLTGFLTTQSAAQLVDDTLSLSGDGGIYMTLDAR